MFKVKLPTLTNGLGFGGWGLTRGLSKPSQALTLKYSVSTVYFEIRITSQVI
jgi:hypothetical protein